MYKFDAAKRDALTAFVTKQLTAFDMRLNEPLRGETEWPKVISMRTDIGVGDEATAFFRQAWAANGNQGNGISWVGRRADGTIPTVSVGDQMVTHAIRPWAQSVDYTIFELEQAQALGRNISDEKVRVVNEKYERDMDIIVAEGDATLGFKGLYNSTDVTASNAANGAGGSPLWSAKTPLEIVKDINDRALAIYKACGESHAPDTLVLPTDQWAYIASTPMSATIPNITILDWLKTRSYSALKNGRELNVIDSRFLAGLGVGSTNRALLYTNSERMVRIAGTPLTRMPVQLRDISYVTPMYATIGEVELVYPQTLGYIDGI